MIVGGVRVMRLGWFGLFGLFFDFGGKGCNPLTTGVVDFALVGSFAK
jgi:hypothetical protein